MELIERPPDTNIVGSRWTFHVKRDNLGCVNNLKSQLIAQGFSQVPGLDFNEMYSPTIQFTSIQLILALVCCYNLELCHIDVKGAYLNGILDEDVYMRQPKGFIKKGKEHLVCKLKKGLYGLKQLGRVWHEMLKQEMDKLGFRPSNTATAVYFRFRSNNLAKIAGWYINDGPLAAISAKSMH